MNSSLSIPIKVTYHSGHKANEYPVCFYWNTKQYEIQQIIDRWYQLDQQPNFPAADYFKVLATDNQLYLLKHELKQDRWMLIVPKKPLVRFSSS